MASRAVMASLPSRGVTGMWIFLGTDAAGFGGLLIANAVLRARATAWPDPHQRFSLPLAAGMTLALLASSLTMTLSVAAAQRGAARAALGWLAATLVGGALFLGAQAAEYRELLTGVPAIGLATDQAASLFYVITGFHGLHVLVGLIYLTALLVPGLRRSAVDAGTLTVAGLFWHFVDFVWVAIFSALYLLPTV